MTVYCLAVKVRRQAPSHTYYRSDRAGLAAACKELMAGHVVAYRKVTVPDGTTCADDPLHLQEHAAWYDQARY